MTKPFITAAIVLMAIAIPSAAQTTWRTGHAGQPHHHRRHAVDANQKARLPGDRPVTAGQGKAADDRHWCLRVGEVEHDRTVVHSLVLCEMR